MNHANKRRERFWSQHPGFHPRSWASRPNAEVCPGSGEQLGCRNCRGPAVAVFKVMTPPAWVGSPAEAHQGAKPHAPSRWRPWPRKGRGRWLSCRPACHSDLVCFCSCGYQATQAQSQLSQGCGQGKPAPGSPYKQWVCSCLRGWGAWRLFVRSPAARASEEEGSSLRLGHPALQMRKLRTREGAVRYLPKVTQLAGLDQPGVCTPQGSWNPSAVAKCLLYALWGALYTDRLT